MSKAWIVRDDHEGYGEIVFHGHGLAARRVGANRLELEFEDVTCERVSRFDQYADSGEVPAKVLIEDGWWFECFQCGSRIDEDRDLGAVIDFGAHEVYCNARCKSNREAEKEQHRIRAEHFKEAVRQARPDLTFTKFFCDWPFKTFQANFTFPGAQYSGGSVRSESGETDDLTWHVAHGDLDAWEMYNSKREIENA